MDLRFLQNLEIVPIGVFIFGFDTDVSFITVVVEICVILDYREGIPQRT
jgi:hypothetical protein